MLQGEGQRQECDTLCPSWGPLSVGEWAGVWPAGRPARCLTEMLQAPRDSSIQAGLPSPRPCQNTLPSRDWLAAKLGLLFATVGISNGG